jgi:branched-chain amino acid transport system substrate-binding protein
MQSASRIGIALSIASLALGAAACGSSDSSSNASGSSGGGGGKSSPKEGVTSNTINYGLIYDQTGPQTASQTPFAHGFITQINKANDAGGINGRKVKLILGDEKGQVPDGIAAYKKMVSQTPVVGITGINSSSIQEAALPLIEKDNMPFVGPQSTVKSGLVPPHKSVFYIVPPYADQVDVLLGYEQKALNKPKPKVGIFRLTASSGIEVGDLVKAAVKKEGGSVVADQQMDVTATSADAQAQKLVSAHPDFIVVHSAPTQSAALLKSMQKLGSKIPLISTFAGGGPLPYAAVPASVGSTFQYTAPTSPSDIKTAGQAQMEADAAKYGYSKDVTDSAYAIGYISGLTVVTALKNAGKDLTRESLIAGLEKINNLDTGGISEPVTYSAQDHVGLSATRPYKYNYSTKKFEAIGEFSDYNSYITHAYGG